MISLDYSDHRPLYEQIRDKMKDLIISGVIAADERLPSVREMASRLAINPNTIQKAYRELEQEGFIYSNPGKGSFASPAAHARVRSDSGKLLKSVETELLELFFLGTPRGEIDKIIDKIYQGGKNND